MALIRLKAVNPNLLLRRFFCSSLSSQSPSSTSDLPLPQSPISPSEGDALHLRRAIDLIRRIRTGASSREEATEALRSSGEELAGNLLQAAIWELRSDWESAFLAFQWGTQRRGKIRHCSDLASWHLMVQILAQHKKFAIAWYLLRMMLHRNLLSPTPFIILIKEYAAANEAGKAIKTFRAMEKLGLAQDSSSWYELLRTLCEHGNAEEAEDLLLANSKLFPLTSQGFNLLLKSAADAATAKRLWREMAARCVPPDETSYALLIESFAMAGNLFEALRLYDDMKRKKGMVPPAEVYRSLIYVMAREGMAGEARKLLGKAAAYDCLARALCEAGKVEEAREVVEGMAEVEKETYWALMGAESLEGSLGLLKRMTEMGCGPDGRVFLVGLEKFFARKEAGNALRVWGEMGRYGVAREEVHFLAVARGLVDCGWMEKGMEVYAAMKRCGFRPDPKLEGIFREHLSGARRWSRGPLRAAPARDWKHDPLRAAPSCVDIEGKSSGRFNVKA